jgi:hypothetical protein
MNIYDEFDEFAWIEQQESGVKQSIAHLRAEIILYERQLAALHAQRVRLAMFGRSAELPGPPSVLRVVY